MEMLQNLIDRGNRFLGTGVPIMCGAMTWISDVELVRAVNDAGGFGVLAGGNMPKSDLESKVNELLKTERSFGVNLITIAPNYREHLEMVCRKGVSHIIFAGSFPRASEVKKAKESGAKVMCFATTVQIASRMIEYGADAIILEGSEAGGHVGPISTSVLVQQFLFDIGNVPIFVGGGIATGKMIVHLLLMGASGVQMGTRFVLTDECRAHQKFKEAFINASAKDAIVTPQFDSSLPVIPVRALKNKGMKEFNRLQLNLLKKLEAGEMTRVAAQYEVERYWIDSLRRAVQEGDVEYGSLMAGQSVGLLKEIKPVKKVIDEIVEDMKTELARIKDSHFSQ